MWKELSEKHTTVAWGMPLSGDFWAAGVTRARAHTEASCTRAYVVGWFVSVCYRLQSLLYSHHQKQYDNSTGIADRDGNEVVARLD